MRRTEKARFRGRRLEKVILSVSEIGFREIGKNGSRRTEKRV